MKTFSLGAAMGLIAFAAVGGCESEDKAPGLGPATANATSGTSSGSSMGGSGGETSSSGNGMGGSSATGGGDCELKGGYFDDAPVGFGDAACDACAQEKCCNDYQKFETDESQASYQDLAQCVVSECDVCFFSICDAKINGEPIGMFFASGCANCVGDNCCESMKTCLDDSDCWLCISGQKDPASPDCTGNPNFSAHDSCEKTHCDTLATCGG